jgi:hypothetical protein
VFLFVCAMGHKASSSLRQDRDNDGEVQHLATLSLEVKARLSASLSSSAVCSTLLAPRRVQNGGSSWTAVFSLWLTLAFPQSCISKLLMVLKQAGVV